MAADEQPPNPRAAFAERYPRIHAELLERARKSRGDAGGHELARLLESYTGAGHILEAFAETLAPHSRDPISAGERAELISVYYAPEGGERALARGASGHLLTDTVYQIGDPDHPQRSIRLGAEAATKLMQTFATTHAREPFTEAGRRRRRERKQATLEEVIEEPSMSEVVADARRLDEVRSLLKRRQDEAALELEQLRERIGEVGRLIGSYPELIEQQLSLTFIAEQRGGPVHRYLEEHWEELPDGIKERYVRVFAPEADTSAQTSLDLQDLLLYAANTIPVDAGAFIGSFLEDAHELERLADDHPLVRRHARPQLHALRDIMKKREVTLLEQARVINAYDYRALRRDHHAALRTRYARSIDAALAQLRGLFVDSDGRLREDAAGASLPMGRLKRESLAPAVLTNDELETAREYCRLEAMRGIDAAMAGLSLRQGRELLLGLVLDARKLDYLAATVASDGIDQATLDEDRREHLVGAYRRSLRRGSSVVLAERFADEHALTLDEFLSRIEDRGPASGMPAHRVREQIKQWQLEGERVVTLARHGLYELKDDSWIAPLAGLAAQLTPADQPLEGLNIRLWAAAAQATALRRSPYVGFGSPSAGDARHRYFTPQEVVGMGCLLRAEQQVREAVERLPLEWRDRLEREEVPQMRFYTGGVHEGSLEITSQLFRAPMRRADAAKEVFVLDADALLSYTPLAQLGEGWLCRARFLVDYSAASLLERAGLHRSSQNDKRELARIDEKESYIHATLAEQVDQLYSRLIDCAPPLEHSVVESGAERYAADDLIKTYSVRVVGTEGRDAGRFKAAMQGFWLQFDGGSWRSKNPLYTHRVAELSQALAGYNERMRADRGDRWRPVRLVIE